MNHPAALDRRTIRQPIRPIGPVPVGLLPVSEYLAAAAPPQRDRAGWLKRQPKLSTPKSAGPDAAQPQPPPGGYRSQRTIGARRPPLPPATPRPIGLCRGVGSSAADRFWRSGKRPPSCHPKAIKAGAWWKETNAEAMLTLRANRATGLWESYCPAQLTISYDCTLSPYFLQRRLETGV